MTSSDARGIDSDWSGPSGAPTELVIFDCDGVLVDSEIVSNEVLAEVITEQGWSLTLQETLARFKGLAIDDIWQIVADRLGRPISEPANRDFRARQLVALSARVQAVPGARELLCSLSIPYCVASNGPPEKMQATLGGTGLLSLLEGRLFSRTEVARPKPYPDLFLHAASMMGVLPRTTLVVEDSPLGVHAALKAGMRVVGFAGTATADASALQQAGAEHVVLHIRDVARFL
jgi:HAD superfamily hydrolase (TIGR01509 family)